MKKFKSNLWLLLSFFLFAVIFLVFYKYYSIAKLLAVFTSILHLDIKPLNFLWFRPPALYKIFTSMLIIIVLGFFSSRDTSNYSAFKLLLHYFVFMIINLFSVFFIGYILDLIPTVEFSSDTTSLNKENLESPILKDVITIEVLLEQSNLPNSSGVNSSSSGLFLIFSKLIDKIPNWLKWLFRVLLLGVLLLNVFSFIGGSALPILGSILLFFKLYTKILLISLCLLVIIYLLLTMFILYWIKDKRVNHKQDLVLSFGKYTPNFIVDLVWNIKLISLTKESIAEFKTGCYIQLLLYLLIIIVITFII